MEAVVLLGVIGLWVLTFSLILILCGIGNELDLLNKKFRDLVDVVKLLVDIVENLDKE